MSRAVHPHACGERLYASSASCTFDGSSPRLWGTERGIAALMLACRFIPTPVGNGFHVDGINCMTPVHPHACGERIGQPAQWVKRVGSSPRLWGTVYDSHQITQKQRFIPTPVGNGARQCMTVSSSSVHPHACGERHMIIEHFQGDTGSSPRLWGTESFHLSKMMYGRFIPTPVGNGCGASTIWPTVPVHPHACGERLCRLDPRRRDHGSSPRLWGTGEPLE